MHESVSFRKGIDGMAGVARGALGHEPMSGAFFVYQEPWKTHAAHSLL